MALKPLNYLSTMMSAATTTPTYASFTELDNNFNLTGLYDDLKKTNSPLLKPLEPTLIRGTQKRQAPGPWHRQVRGL